MSDNFTIRKGTHSDLSFLIESITLMVQETEKHVVNQKVISKGVNSILSTPRNGFYIISELNDQPIGSLQVSALWQDLVAGCYWWVQSLHVRESYRKRGCCRAMLNYVFLQAENEENVRGVRLLTHNQNENASQVLREYGFVETPYRMMQKT